jgi:Smg protein
MFDVLVYLYENFPALNGAADADTLARKLSAAGFDKDEISDALAWLQGLAQVTQAAQSVREAGRDTFRVYPGFERERLGTEGVDFLAFLESAGQLSGAQREIVIERALAVGQQDGEWPVQLAKLKLIVLMVLWSQQADIDVLLLEELLDDGDDRLLH